MAQYPGLSSFLEHSQRLASAGPDQTQPRGLRQRCARAKGLPDSFDRLARLNLASTARHLPAWGCLEPVTDDVSGVRGHLAKYTPERAAAMRRAPTHRRPRLVLGPGIDVGRFRINDRDVREEGLLDRSDVSVMSARAASRSGTRKRG